MGSKCILFSGLHYHSSHLGSNQSFSHFQKKEGDVLITPEIPRFLCPDLPLSDQGAQVEAILPPQVLFPRHKDRSARGCGDEMHLAMSWTIFLPSGQTHPNHPTTCSSQVFNKQTFNWMTQSRKIDFSQQQLQADIIRTAAPMG